MFNDVKYTTTNTKLLYLLISDGGDSVKKLQNMLIFIRVLPWDKGEKTTNDEWRLEKILMVAKNVAMRKLTIILIIIM